MKTADYERFRERLGLTEPPLAFYYSRKKPAAGISPKEGGRECIVALLKRARVNGVPVYFDTQHAGCPGGAYYLGFSPASMPGIEYFLSCGIPGKMAGERYIKTPEIAREYFQSFQPRKAPAPYAVFEPLTRMTDEQKPEVVIFFVSPDALSGLVVLTGFSTGRFDSVAAPFSSGCGSIVTLPLEEGKKKKPRAVLGMFDISARCFVERDILTLAMPWRLFEELLENQDESFLVTESWRKIRKRIKPDKPVKKATNSEVESAS